MADDSITYGPAQERHTHTPINFQSTKEGNFGQYIGFNPLSVIQALPLLFQNPSSIVDLYKRGVINVDPSKEGNDVNKTLQHEAVHAAQAQSPVSDQIAQVARKTPGYKNMLGAIQKVVGKQDYPEDETIAYAAENDPIYHLPQDVRNSYVGQLVDQLMKIDPSTAKTYQALAAGK